MTRSKLSIIVWFAFAVITFWLLDRYSISVGDDLGYMFSDSALHKGDGKLIATIGECFTTQAKHYVSTNGRFLVHATTHFFTAIAGLDIFRIANSIMFGLLWLLIVRFITPWQRIKNMFPLLLSLFMLWVGVPDAGTTMLSLVAFAVNYMWTAVAYLAFILLLKWSATTHRPFRQNVVAYLFCGITAIAIGSLQESYSLPISAALFILSVFNLKKIKPLSLTMIVGFFVGCGIGVFAPGNLRHAAQGGGFSFDSILRKCEALSHEVLLSAIILLILILAILAIINVRQSMRIIHQNAFFLIAIAVSLLFAVFTFTSSRQLFCPSIFSIIVIGRIIMQWAKKVIFRSSATITMGLILLAILVAAYPLRHNSYSIYEKVLRQLGGSKKLIVANAAHSNYNTDCDAVRLLAERYAPDPLENKTLHLLFDGYTKRGLSRMGWENQKSTNIANFIPYPASVIEGHFAPHSVNIPIKNTYRFKALSVALDDRFKSVRLEKTTKDASKYMPFESEKDKSAIAFEKFIYKDYIYFVLPHNAPDTVVLKQ